MEAASRDVISGEVTYAVRDTTTDGVQINKRDYIGLEQGRVMVAGKDLVSTTRNWSKAAVKRKVEIVSLFYGRDVIQTVARELLQLRAEFADPEWELYEGGQPLYYYLVAVE